MSVHMEIHVVCMCKIGQGFELFPTVYGAEFRPFAINPYLGEMRHKVRHTLLDSKADAPMIAGVSFPSGAGSGTSVLPMFWVGPPHSST